MTNKLYQPMPHSGSPHALEVASHAEAASVPRARQLDGDALAFEHAVSDATDGTQLAGVPEVPAAIADAAARFAMRVDTEPEDSGWFNSKSNDFVHVSGCLPDGWRELGHGIP